MLIFNIPSTLATWTIGVMLLANKRDGEVVSLKARLKKLGISLISPCMISGLVSVVLVLCNITDSGVPAHTLTTIGQFTLPGAMFVLATFTLPSRRTMMFWGLMSRWTMPRLWAWLQRPA